MEVDQTNLELRRTVAAYLMSKDKNTVEERIVAETTVTSEKVGGIMKTLEESVRNKVEEICRVWIQVPAAKLKFTFSSTFKNKTIELGEQNTRATRTGNQEWAVAAVEPKLSKTTPSRIKFQVNNPHDICIGLCFRSAVEPSFLVENNARMPFKILSKQHNWPRHLPTQE